MEYVEVAEGPSDSESMSESDFHDVDIDQDMICDEQVEESNGLARPKSPVTVPPPKKRGRPKQPKVFRFNARHVALTYPQCGDLKSEEVLRFFQSQWGVKEYYIRRCEHDADHEGWHIHAYIMFPKKINVRGNDVFDVMGHHPHVDSIKGSRNGWLRYMRDENVGEEPLKNIDVMRMKNEWAKEALKIGEETGDVEKVMEFLKDTEPQRLIMSYGQIKANLELMIRRPQSFTADYYPQGVTADEPMRHCKQTILDWYHDNVRRGHTQDRFKLLVLVGPARVGKTQLARSLDPGHHAYFDGKFTASSIRHDDNYWVFDDCNFEYIENKKALLTGNCCKRAAIEGKWMPRHSIDVKPSIWCCNEQPNFDQWWFANTVIVHIPSDLY